MGVAAKERRRLEAQQFMAERVEPVVVEVINDLYRSRAETSRDEVFFDSDARRAGATRLRLVQF